MDLLLPAQEDHVGMVDVQPVPQLRRVPVRAVAVLTPVVEVQRRLPLLPFVVPLPVSPPLVPGITDPVRRPPFPLQSPTPTFVGEGEEEVSDPPDPSVL